MEATFCRRPRALEGMECDAGLAAAIYKAAGCQFRDNAGNNMQLWSNAVHDTGRVGMKSTGRACWQLTVRRTVELAGFCCELNGQAASYISKNETNGVNQLVSSLRLIHCGVQRDWSTQFNSLTTGSRVSRASHPLTRPLAQCHGPWATGIGMITELLELLDKRSGRLSKTQMCCANLDQRHL
ncbi:hypothetical protein BJX62DRAFT_38828 [Aspergillus germanicus]